MPTFKQITQYVITDELFNNEEIQIRYTGGVQTTLQEDLDKLYVKENVFIPGRVMGLARRLNSGYSDLYLNDCFKHHRSDNELLCYSLISAMMLLPCEYFNQNKNNDSYRSMLSEHGEWWLMLFACNQFDLIPHCYPKMIEDLLEGRLERSIPRRHEPQRLGVLALEMMASEYKQTIDWEGADIPADPFYLRFCQEALYSTDEALVKQWLTELCDKHLEWASLPVGHSIKNNLLGYEVELPVLLLWPFEYQAVKNFRARHGLSTPEIDHPLCGTPLAIPHRPDFHCWKKPEWFFPLLDHLAKTNPQLSFLKTFFMAKV